MDELRFIKKETLRNIANAIRRKYGTVQPLDPDYFAANVDNLGKGFQFMTVVDPSMPDILSSYVMPEGTTFQQFIGGPYDNSGGRFDTVSDGTQTAVTFDGNLIFNAFNDPSPAPSELAVGSFYYGTRVVQGLVVQNANNVLDYFEFYVPNDTAFKDFVNSPHDLSGGRFTINSNGSVCFDDNVLYDIDGYSVTEENFAFGRFTYKGLRVNPKLDSPILSAMNGVLSIRSVSSIVELEVMGLGIGTTRLTLLGPDAKGEYRGFYEVYKHVPSEGDFVCSVRAVPTNEMKDLGYTMSDYSRSDEIYIRKMPFVFQFHENPTETIVCEANIEFCAADGSKCTRLSYTYDTRNEYPNVEFTKEDGGVIFACYNTRGWENKAYAIIMFGDSLKPILSSRDLIAKLEQIGGFWEVSDLTYVDSGKTMTCDGYSSTGDNTPSVYIPSIYSNSKQILGVKDKAFYGDNTIERLCIRADADMFLGTDTFNGCRNLRVAILPKLNWSVEMPASDKRTFFACTALENVMLAEGTLGIPPECFNLSGIKEMKFPSSLHSIGDSAFLGCSNLYKVELPLNLHYIGARAFYGCPKLTDISYNGTTDEFLSFVYNIKDDAFGGSTPATVIRCKNGDVDISNYK